MISEKESKGHSNSTLPLPKFKNNLFSYYSITEIHAYFIYINVNIFNKSRCNNMKKALKNWQIAKLSQ